MNTFKRYWYWYPVSMMMGFVLVGSVYAVIDNYKAKPKVVVGKKITITSGATKLRQDTVVFGLDITLIGWDPHKEIKNLIDSAYRFEIAKDSIAKMQLMVLYSGEDNNYIKHEYNRLEGKRNRYKDMIIRTYDSLKPYLEREDGQHFVPPPTFFGPSPIDTM